MKEGRSNRRGLGCIDGWRKVGALNNLEAIWSRRECCRGGIITSASPFKMQYTSAMCRRLSVRATATPPSTTDNRLELEEGPQRLWFVSFLDESRNRRIIVICIKRAAIQLCALPKGRRNYVDFAVPEDNHLRGFPPTSNCLAS